MPAICSTGVPPSKLVESNVPTLSYTSAGAGELADYSSWLVIAGLGELCGVARPVAAGLVHPAAGRGGVQAEEVGEDGCGDLGCEVGQCGPPAGLGGDAEGPEPSGEPCRGDGAA